MTNALTLSRRSALGLGVAAATVAVVGLPAVEAQAATDLTKEAIMAFTGGKMPAEGRVDITAPEIAENGNTVPVAIAVDSPMTKDDYVAEVLILAAGNPRPGVATFRFSPMSAAAEASTRIRLAKTQDVVAVAKMSDGSTYMARRTVKVTIGGCGG